MFEMLQVTAVMLVAAAMALALAHALELPGKLRLPEEVYRTVQRIYYPGFTIGGIAEPVALLALLALLILSPAGAAFWLTFGAFLALAAMHGTYWLLTHPVNNFWLEDFRLGKAGSAFFARNAGRRGDRQPDWTVLRDRWEYSHVIRAAFGLLSLLLLATATAL